MSSIPFDLFTNGDGTSDLTNTAKTFKTGKLLRLFKLSKIIRIVRAARVSRRLEDQLDLAGRAPFQIFKICSGTAFLSHLFACGWAGMARVEGNRTYGSSVVFEREARGCNSCYLLISQSMNSRTHESLEHMNHSNT